MNTAAIEQEIIADIAAAPAIAADVVTAIQTVKTSPLQATLEKRWPGISAVEDEALKGLSFIPTFSPTVIKWLDLLFPQPAA